MQKIFSSKLYERILAYLSFDDLSEEMNIHFICDRKTDLLLQHLFIESINSRKRNLLEVSLPKKYIVY